MLTCNAPFGTGAIYIMSKARVLHDLVSKKERQARPIFIMDDNVVKGLDYSFADFI